jgi:hypothetical protein
LLVCRSQAAAKSDHVSSEIDYFSWTRGGKNILVVDVGDENHDKSPFMRALENTAVSELLTQSILGTPTSWIKSDAANRQNEANAILAALLGLRDKRQLDTRIRVAWMTTLLIGLLISAGLHRHHQWYLEWLETPNGRKHQTVLQIREYGKQNNEYDNPSLATTAVSFGKLNDRESIEALVATVRDPDFRRTVEACGMLALPEPDLDRARMLLAEDSFFENEGWHAATLALAGAIEGSAPTKIKVQPKDLPSVVELFCLAGKSVLAERELLSRADFPPDDLLRAWVIAASTSQHDSSIPSEAIESLRQLDNSQLVHEVTQLLFELDIADRLNSIVATQLLPFAIQAGNEADFSDMLVWRKSQQLAAELAGAGKAIEASNILDATDSWATTVLNDQRRHSPSDSYVFMWRSLAFSRLGDLHSSMTYYQLAKQCFDSGKMTRSYSEVRELAYVHVCWNDWEGAFNWADSARQPFIKFETRCKLIELWARRNKNTIQSKCPYRRLRSHLRANGTPLNFF